jgi:uncharacterized protein YbjT (DUF2867 family)
MSRILVTGGTGMLGRVLVARLRADGHETRVLSRRPGDLVGDLTTGAGLAAALAGTDVVVHCASNPRHDIAGTRNLLAAASGQHIVYVSIVGVDAIPLGYYRRKLACERLVEESGLPWTVQRATQFHDLVAQILRAVSGPPVVPALSGISLQPCDVRDVADRLADLALGPPAGRAPDFGGPAVHSWAALTRKYLRSVGKRRTLVPVRLPGKVFRGFRAGGNLTPGHADGRITFEEYLASR